MGVAMLLKYKYECGCVSDAELTVKKRSANNSYIRVCPKHFKPAVTKIGKCDLCGGYMERDIKAGGSFIACTNCTARLKHQHRRNGAKPTDTVYTTDDEIEFVSNLPKHKVERYLEVSQLRERWGPINKDAVIQACQARLSF